MAQLKCPKCKKLHEYDLSNPYRPFCSERCKMVDLGQWANEEYAIPSNKPVNRDDLEAAGDKEHGRDNRDDDSDSGSDLH